MQQESGMQNVIEKAVVNLDDVPEWCDEIVAYYVDGNGHKVGENLPFTIAEKNGIRTGSFEVELGKKMSVRYGLKEKVADIDW